MDPAQAGEVRRVEGAAVKYTHDGKENRERRGGRVSLRELRLVPRPPRGVGRAGSGGSDGGRRVYPRLIHVNVRGNPHHTLKQLSSN